LDPLQTYIEFLARGAHPSQQLGFCIDQWKKTFSRRTTASWSKGGTDE